MSDSPRQAFIVRLLHQDTCADHWRRNSRLKKKSRIINRSVCTSVTSVFKTSGLKEHFLLYAGAKIRKRQEIVEKENEYAKRNK